MGTFPFQVSPLQATGRITIPQQIEMIASKILMLCLVALTMFNLSNGDDSKEACYRECADVCNQERKRVEQAIWGTDFFQYVLDKTIPWDSWVDDDTCYLGVQVLMIAGVKLITTDDLSLLTSGIEIRTLHLAYKYVLVFKDFFSFHQAFYMPENKIN